jgi:hypothetical protein
MTSCVQPMHRLADRFCATLRHVHKCGQLSRTGANNARVFRLSLDTNCGKSHGGEAQAGGGISPKPIVRESRRSTRVRLKVMIETKGLSEPLACEGETQVINLHGALISTAVALRVGMKIEIRVILTDKRASAKVVYVDPDQPRHCGIELEQPKNIWGVPLPPDDWRETD